jgi:hypothetical protein
LFRASIDLAEALDDMSRASAGAGINVGMETRGVVSSHNDLHDVLDPAQLGKGTCWEAKEEAPQFNVEQASEQSARTSQEPRPAINPLEPGWMGICEDDFNNGFHGAREGRFVSAGSSSPQDVLQGREGHGGSLATLRRQGAMKIKCDSVWDESRECSALLDLRWMEDNKTQVKSLNGHFALLQQTLPHGNQLSVTMTEENLQNLGDVSFGQMLLDVDKSFKGSCAPYQELGSSQRERLFLRTLRSRVPLRTSYLSSVALDALSAHASSGYRPSENPPPAHLWEPSSVACSEGSILRKLLGTCERRCTPEDQLTKVMSSKTRESDEQSNLPQRIRSLLWGAGIISPWLYLMNPGSVFCCHIEDYAFGSANVIIAPPGSHTWAAWYSVPRHDIGYLHEYLREMLGDEYTIDCLEQRKIWLDPASVSAWTSKEGKRIHVYRHLQGPSEYIATDYGSVHWGVNLGIGWKAAVNFAFPDWWEAAQGIHLEYKKLEKATGQKRSYRSVPDFDSKKWDKTTSADEIDGTC